MKKAWIGMAFLSASWLVGTGYYHQADLVAWGMLVALGTVFMGGALSRRPSAGVAIFGAVLLLPAAWLLGWPERIGPLLLAAGLVLAGLPVARDWLRRVGLPLAASGLVLTAQALAIAAYAALTARNHDLPAPIAQLLALAVGLLGAGTGPADGTANAAGGALEFLLNPLVIIFLIGAALLLVNQAWASADRRRGLGQASGSGALDTVRVLVAMGVLVFPFVFANVDVPASQSSVFVGLASSLLDADVVLTHANLALGASGGVHTIGATWGLLLDPATVCFLAGAGVMILMRTWDVVGSRRRFLRAFDGLIMLSAGVLLWLPLRAALMIGIYCHRDMLAGAGDGADLAGQLLNPWLHLALLAGPVLVAMRVVRPVASGEAITTMAPGGQPERIRGGLAVMGTVAALLAGVAMTGAVLWDPIGRAKPGRVLWDEYHSQQPWPGKQFDATQTDRPFDTQWFGRAAASNYSRIYDYVSHFYKVSRIKTPLGENALSDTDVLVLKVPSKAYTLAEIDAIEHFVQRGGGVLMIGEHTNAFGSGEILNKLARRMGFEIRCDRTRPADAPTGLAGRPQLAPHPIMQYVGDVDLAGGATIGFDTGRAVVLRTGLRSLPSDYAAPGLTRADDARTDIRYGAFAQVWSHRRGAGRVVAIADASIFTNLSAFEPRRRELMIGMLAWLNRENTFIDPRPMLAIAAVCLALLAMAMARPIAKAWPLVVGAAALGWAGTIFGVAIHNRTEMPPPSPIAPMVQIAIDTGISDAQLPHDGAPSGGRRAFGQFERSILRLGYFPRRAAGAALLGGDVTGDPNAVVVIRPAGEITDQYRRMLMDYVESGGTLVVLDSPDNKQSSANRLLEPFGLKFDMTEALKGDLKAEAPLPALAVSAAWVVEGGASLATLAGRAVAAVAKPGRGAVLAVGFGSRFSDAGMGASPDIVPNPDQRKAFEFEFTLFRQIIESRLPGEPAPLHRSMGVSPMSTTGILPVFLPAVPAGASVYDAKLCMGKMPMPLMGETPMPLSQRSISP